MRPALPLFVRRASLATFALVFMLALNEGLARSIETSFDIENFNLAGSGNDPRCIRPSVSRGWEPVPDQCGVNEHGANVSLAPPGAVGEPIRVMLVGDSISAYGGWSSILAKALSRHWAGRPVEVQAYAAAGYNTCQELSMYLEQVEVARPDFVILQSCANDLVGSPVLLRVGKRVRYFVNDAFIEFPAWVTHSRLLTLATLSFGPQQPYKRATDSLAMVQKCLADLQSAVAARGIPLTTVFFPLFWSRIEAPEGLLAEEDAMRRILAESGISMVDLRPEYEAAGPIAGFRSHQGDFIHPSVRGQEIAAEATSRFMEATLPPPIR